MIAIGTTDLIFALDSIPAIFGLTQEAYLVFTANVFALMGLRQLYFLLGGLLDRLVYLSAGLAVILGFIGVKLILEALHKNNLPFLNGGHPVEWVPAIPTCLSLSAIIATLSVTTVASLVKSPRDRRWERSARVGPVVQPVSGRRSAHASSGHQRRVPVPGDRLGHHPALRVAGVHHLALALPGAHRRARDEPDVVHRTSRASEEVQLARPLLAERHGL